MRNIAKMLIIILICVGLFSALGIGQTNDVAASEGAITTAMSIDEALAYALSHNESLAIAKAQMDKAKAKVDEAIAGYLPNFTGNAQFIKRENLENAFDNYTIQATLPVDLNGFIGINKDVQSKSRFIAEQNYRLAKQKLILDTKHAYYNVLRASELYKVSTEALENAKLQLLNAQQRVSAGTAAQFEVMRAETTVKANEQALISAKNVLALSQRAFNNVLGRSISTPVVLVEVSNIPPLTMNLEALQDKAESNRPEIEQLKGNLKIQKILIKVAQRVYWPSMSLVGAYNYSPDGLVSAKNGEKDSYQIMAMVSMTLFDSGKASAMLRQQKNEVKIAEKALSQSVRAIALEVEQSYLNLINAKERLAVAESALSLAKESLRLARVRYENGVSIQVEVSDAELAYTQAQSSFVSSRYDYLVAYAQLMKAIGEDGVNKL